MTAALRVVAAVLLTSVITPVPALAILPAVATDADAVRAPELLQRVAETYATLDVYFDSGSAVQEYGVAGDESPRQRTYSFATSFLRCRHYGFVFYPEGKAPGYEIVVLEDDGEEAVRRRGVDGKAEHRGELNMAVAGSLSPAQTTAALLFSETHMGWKRTDLFEATRVEELEAASPGFFVVRGRHPHRDHRGTVVTLWIDRDSSLIHRIESESETPVGSFKRSTEYAPRAITWASSPESSRPPEACR